MLQPLNKEEIEKLKHKINTYVDYCFTECTLEKTFVWLSLIDTLNKITEKENQDERFCTTNASTTMQKKA